MDDLERFVILEKLEPHFFEILEMSSQGKSDREITNLVKKPNGGTYADGSIKKNRRAQLEKLELNQAEISGLLERYKIWTGSSLALVAANTFEQFKQVNSATIQERQVQLEKVTQIRASGLVLRFLVWYYHNRVTFLTAHGKIYPCSFTDNTFEDKGVEFFQNQIVMDLTYKAQDHLPNYDYRFYASSKTLRQNGSNHLDNGVSKCTFALKNLDSDTPPKMNLYVSDYFTGLDTSESLGWELMSQLVADSQGGSEADLFARVAKKLPQRRRIEIAMGTDQNQQLQILQGVGRAATIGCAMLFVYRDADRQYRCTLGTRSAEGVAAQPNSVHVAPAGMFQSECTLQELLLPENKEEWQIDKRIFCELLEEVLDKSEEYEEPRIPYRIMKKDPQLSVILEMLKTGKADFLVSGIAVDLLNLRPEICVVLILHEYSEIIVDNIKSNREYHGKRLNQILLSTLENPTSAVPSDSGFFAPQNMVASGAACLWKGFEQIKGYLRTP